MGIFKKLYYKLIGMPQPRVYNPSCGMDYQTWKSREFGLNKVNELKEKNCLEGRVWKLHNDEVCEFYKKRYVNDVQVIIKYQREYTLDCMPYLRQLHNI